MNALDVARAALMEVGEDPRAMYLTDDGRLAWWRPVDHARYHRAAILARLAVEGPDYLARCVECSEIPTPEPCISVREALIGHTCGRTIAVAPCAAHRRSQ